MEKNDEGNIIAMDLKKYIRGIPDFPKPGILFYDISTLLANPEAWRVAMERMARLVSRHRPDVLAGIESRGFLVAAPLALKLGCGFVMVRKEGKLPGPCHTHEYDLEYGSNVVQIQKDSVDRPKDGCPGRPARHRRNHGGGDRSLRESGNGSGRNGGIDRTDIPARPR